MYYSNGFDNTYDELLTFYPIYYFDVFEMREILKAQGKILDAVRQYIDTAIKNNYVQDADEPTILRLERFLHIPYDGTKTLEERRRMVLAFFVGFGKISATVIKSIIATFTDCPVEVDLPRDEDKNCYVRIFIPHNSDGVAMFADINTILSVKIPTHLKISYQQSQTIGELERCTYGELKPYTYGGMKDRMIIKPEGGI